MAAHSYTRPLLSRLSMNWVGVAGLFITVALASCLGGLEGAGRPDQEVTHIAAVRAGPLSVERWRFLVDGQPYDVRRSFPHGPGTHYNVYSEPHPLYLVRGKGGEPGVLWQEREGMDVRLSWLGRRLDQVRTVTMLAGDDQHLAAAAQDAAGTIYFLTVQAGNGMPDDAREAALHKASLQGKVLRSVALDTSPEGLNMVMFSGDGYHSGNSASLQVTDSTVGLILGRRMHRGKDGLNHQGGIAAVFDSKSLAVVKNWGQTSGHSFESRLATNGSGEFVGIDLGDNYPRGVNLHVFSRKGHRSTVVYTFKTEHGNEPQSPAGRAYPAYKKISRNGRRYYQWSNDNRTYTELGGVIPGKGGHTVIFAGEHHRGKALDSARVGNYLNDARNIGLVRVRSDFPDEHGQRNAVAKSIVLSKGAAEEGGFYTFGGNWSPQRNQGVVWLTDYASPAEGSVTRLHTAPLADGTILLLWERWNAVSYLSTHALRIDSNGKKLGKVATLPPEVRLPRSGTLAVEGNRIYVINGDAWAGTLELAVLTVQP